MMSVVRPRISRSSAACTMRSLSASSALVASSSSSTGRSASSARAIASRWRCPPDSRTPRSPRYVSIALRQARDELVRERRVAGGAHLVVARVRAARSARSRRRSQQRSPAPAAPARCAAHGQRVGASRGPRRRAHRARLGIVEAQQQLEHRASCRRPTARPARASRPARPRSEKRVERGRVGPRRDRRTSRARTRPCRATAAAAAAGGLAPRSAGSVEHSTAARPRPRRAADRPDHFASAPAALPTMAA